METLLMVIESILGLAIIITILLQPSKSDGLSGLIQGRSETFFSKNKGRTREAMLARITIISMVLFAVNTILLNLIK
ncbi:preprotein translocase subunit SecG [Clostridium intestinale]|uniref:Protein-export membrane protein SecG n=2 Tax=Clostridium intestinale TaxID=36845 RepID=U2Q0U2_9CLOT|nr:preprotein translocase subunit SecG [Clostridium intestinale]ERK29644.1 preprotein translocase subunit SecG [Clostridium intestinale URNW]QLY80990.1 preprotein translocase subunit SecG [Clostridium intestinale]